MKKFVGNILAILANLFLKALRNGRSPDFSREEIRSVYFSFGQFGEDLAVERWVRMLDIERGIYVDVGAFDPVRSSNTLLLHRRGWHGVNVDMDPERIKKFVKARPADYSVSAAVSDRLGEDIVLKFPIGETDRLASVAGPGNKSLANECAYETHPITTVTLDSILATCPFVIPWIDYLTVDVEGHDLAVLKGLDFDRYCPVLISVEISCPGDEYRMCQFLEPKGYSVGEKSFRSLLFVRSESRPSLPGATRSSI